MMLIVALSAYAFAGTELSIDFPEHPGAERYREGSVSEAPVPHWRTRLPGGRVNSGSHTERAGPLLLEDEILVGSAAGKALFRLNRATGSRIGKYAADGSVEAAPVVLDDRVFFSDTAGSTWCYALSGELVWKHEGSAPILASPMVHEGQVYVTNVDDLAVAVDANTGELEWRYQAPRDLTRESELTLYAAPAAVVDGDQVLFGFSDGSIVSLNAESGDVAWQLRVGEDRYPDVVAAPVPHGDDIFASGYYKPLVAIDRNSQNVRWRADFGSASAVAVASVDGKTTVFHSGSDGKVRAFSALTGAEYWAWDSGTTSAITEPVIVEAGLLVGATDGGLYLLDPVTGIERWRYHEPRQLQGVTARPAVQGRQVVFVSNGGYIHSMVTPLELEQTPELWK